MLKCGPSVIRPFAVITCSTRTLNSKAFFSKTTFFAWSTLRLNDTDLIKIFLLGSNHSDNENVKTRSISSLMEDIKQL